MLAGQLDQLGQRRVGVDRLHLRARHHQFARRQIAELEGSGHQLTIRLLDQAAHLGGLDQHLELLDRVRGLFEPHLAHAKQTQHDRRGAVEQPDQRPEDQFDKLGRTADANAARSEYWIARFLGTISLITTVIEVTMVKATRAEIVRRTLSSSD